MPARLLSLNVGLPREVAWKGKIVRTSVWKEPVTGPRLARRLNIDGDGQGDLAGHGGEHRAVYVYQMDSYRYWESELGRTDFAFGQFGENLTVEGLSDQDVCIGDRYRIGDALFEVTQPRVTCYRLGIRMNDPQMPSRLVERGRPGFYFRVLEEGHVQAGDEIIQVGVAPERMTVSEINALLYLPGRSLGSLERALRIPALSAGWRGSFSSMLAEEHAGAPAQGASPEWRGFRKMRVTQRTSESTDVVSFTFEPVDGRPLKTALAGQFVVLRLAVRPGEAPQTRSYSLSGKPSDRSYRVSIKREPHGAVSGFIHETVESGDIIEMSAPRGDFILRPSERPVVLLSAGVGATTVLAMLHALATEGSSREIWWLHGARNGREHPFAEEVRSLLKTMARAGSHVRYSSPAPEDRLGVDFDASGHLDVAALGELGSPRDADFYICGPSAFMKELAAGLASWGVASENIHSETFGPGASLTPGVIESPQPPPHAPADPSETGPTVSFTRSGLSVHWGVNYRSLLELAEACDIPTRWACRAGVCHTCETGLVTGEVEYEPDPLTPPSQASVLICCSRPRGDIVIDL